MGRLIDADKFKTEICAMTIANNYNSRFANLLCDLIDSQPTAYDVDKVVGQLTEEYTLTGMKVFDDCINKTIDRAIKIVKEGAVKDE